MLRACVLYAVSCSGISLWGLKWSLYVQACHHAPDTRGIGRGLVLTMLVSQTCSRIFVSPLDPQAGWPGRYINVQHCGGLAMAPLQLKDPLELFVKRFRHSCMSTFIIWFCLLSRKYFMERQRAADRETHVLIRVSPSNITRAQLRFMVTRVLASRVSGCLLDSLVHEKYLILGKTTPLILVCFFYKY